MKAMILAAGRGERLRPLTDTIAKPLVEVKGKPLIVHHLLALADIGVTDIVVNVYYLAKQVMETLGDGGRFGVNIAYIEEPHLLGAGGTLLNAKHLLGNEPFILISGDIYTNFPLASLKLKHGKLGHLILTDNPGFHPEGDFALEDTDDNTIKLISLNRPQKLTYASIAMLHPQLLNNIPVTHMGIIPLLEPAINDGLITGEYYQGMLHNIGTETELKAANQS